MASSSNSSSDAPVANTSSSSSNTRMANTSPTSPNTPMANTSPTTSNTRMANTSPSSSDVAMNNASSSSSDSSETNFNFDVKWAVPDGLKSNNHPNLWDGTTISIPHCDTNNQLRERIKAQIHQRLVQHEKYTADHGGLCRFMKYLVDIDKDKSKDNEKNCRLVRFWIDMTSVGGPADAKSETVEMECGVFSRFEYILDFTNDPEAFKKKKVELKVILAIMECYSGTAMQPGDTLDRFIHSAQPPTLTDYVKIGTIQDKQASNVSLLKIVNKKDRFLERKNVILARYKETVTDKTDIEDELRVLNTWRFFNKARKALPWHIGDCDGGGEFSLSELNDKGINVSKEFWKDDIPPTFSELKSRIEDKCSAEKKTPPYLPRLTMNPFPQANDTSWKNQKWECEAVIRIVYLLSDSELTPLEKLCPQDLWFDIDNHTTFAQLDQAIFNDSKDQKDKLNKIANGGVLDTRSATKRTWWIMPDGESMKKMHKVDLTDHPLKYVDKTRTPGGKGSNFALYMECHMRDPTSSTQYTSAGI